MKARGGGGHSNVGSSMAPVVVPDEERIHILHKLASGTISAEECMVEIKEIEHQYSLIAGSDEGSHAQSQADTVRNDAAGITDGASSSYTRPVYKVTEL